MGLLSGRQAKAFQDALLSAFDPSELKQLVYFSLDEDLHNITPGGDFRERTFELLRWTERKGYTEELIASAVKEVPGNPSLKRFDVEYRRSNQKRVSHRELEKIVDKNQKFKSARRWRDRLERIERQVCRIELAGRAKGSGFLVAPNVVLTNYHVVENVLENKADPSALAVRFDYHLKLEADIPDEGVVYGLDDDWLIGKSPYDPVDLKSKPKEYEPDREHLDYAFLRVEKRVAEDVVDGERRDIVPLPAEEPTLEPGAPMFIAQHPVGRPMELALNTKSILEVNPNETRVRHETNTDAGSSGSPCFDADWNLIALHHSGDPKKIKPEYNEGIPITTIQEELKPAVKATIGWS